MAGTKTEQVLRRHFSHHPSLQFDSLTDDQPIWHDSLQKRRRRDPSFLPGNRTVVVGMRPLTDWLYSRYRFEKRRSPHLPHDPERLRQAEFLEVSGRLNQADRYMRHYLPPETLARHPVRVIRVDHFVADFRRIFGDWLDLSAIDDQDLALPVNSTAGFCEEARRILDRHRSEIYAASPWWSAVEACVYGHAGEP